MSMKYFKVYHDLEDAINALSDAEAGRLFKAVIRYLRKEPEVDLPGREKLVFKMFKVLTKRDRR